MPLGKLESRGCCQWVLDTACQAGEWPSSAIAVRLCRPLCSTRRKRVKVVVQFEFDATKSKLDNRSVAVHD